MHLLALETYEAASCRAEVTRALRGPDWHVSFASEQPPVLWTPRPEDAPHRNALSPTLDELASRESRSVATTWRFAPASIREALDYGWTAEWLGHSSGVHGIP